MHCFCHIVFGLKCDLFFIGLGKVGDFGVWRKVMELGKYNFKITRFEINKPASGSVKELPVCRVWVIGFVFSSHLHNTKYKPHATNFRFH